MGIEVSVTHAALIFWLDKWLKDGGSTKVPARQWHFVIQHTISHMRRDDILGSYCRGNLRSYTVLELFLSCLTLRSTRIHWHFQLFQTLRIECLDDTLNWKGPEMYNSCCNLILRIISKFAWCHSGRPRKTPVRIVGFKPGISCVRSRSADWVSLTACRTLLQDCYFIITMLFVSSRSCFTTRVGVRMSRLHLHVKRADRMWQTILVG